MNHPVLAVRNLQVQFPSADGLIQAVKGVSFEVQRGQTLGIVGESGSGKSVTALTVMGLLPAATQVAGEIWFQHPEAEPVNLLTLPPDQRRTYRGRQTAMIFQEPLSSLNPVYTCGFQLIEALRQHQTLSPAAARRQAWALLQEVKLLASNEALREQGLAVQAENLGHQTSLTNRQLHQWVNRQKQALLDRYPHQLSGGQIQRVMIAMALGCHPSVLIADEPTTALDVTVQATILELLRELRDRRQMSMIFITHDLGIIAEIADRVAVMYQGQIVEAGPVEQIFAHPQHPYTRGLLACRPRPDLRLQFLPTISDFMTGNGEPSTAATVVPQPLVSDAEIPPEVLTQRLTTLQQQSPLLSVHHLQVAFPVRGLWGETKRYTLAVNDVSFDVYPGGNPGIGGGVGLRQNHPGAHAVALDPPCQWPNLV
ncbi:ATP-binding cassette domain-containing protein [Neosynechococcus sphagnicola]|uniref:ATP-binding cassette domain-containing protein n=1 Tax=Neosynechococcus sphagnicola TaxID=1501145 RepID=UPI000AE771A4